MDNILIFCFLIFCPPRPIKKETPLPGSRCDRRRERDAFGERWRFSSPYPLAAPVQPDLQPVSLAVLESAVESLSKPVIPLLVIRHCGRLAIKESAPDLFYLDGARRRAAVDSEVLANLPNEVINTDTSAGAALGLRPKRFASPTLLADPATGTTEHEPNGSPSSSTPSRT